MAYEERLAQRVRDVLADQPGLVERKMFGGVAFMLQGNMACGVMNDELIVRVGPEKYPAAKTKPHTREFDFTGRPMKGFIVVTPEGHGSDEALEEWVRRGAEFALSLPAK